MGNFFYKIQNKFQNHSEMFGTMFYNIFRHTELLHLTQRKKNQFLKTTRKWDI
jgi:hypothetical protein